jgi:hypothetical protein
MTAAVQSPRLIAPCQTRSLVFPSQPRAWADPIHDPLNLLVAALFSVLIICGLLAFHDEMLGWYLLPVFLCGTLIGPDMVAWVRGRLDLFDPLGILGTYGYFFFFLAPLLTVMWRYHTRELPEPPDWMGWIGWMSALNFFGLTVYLLGRGVFIVHKPRTVWTVKPSAFFAVMSVALPLAFVFQVNIFVRFGGVWGFMSAFSNIASETFRGMGWEFLIAEMFPVLLAILFMVWKRNLLQQRSWGFLISLIGFFFLLKLLFGGLRGSRSNTVWALFWLVGAIHLWVRRVPRQIIVTGLLFLTTFMYLYGFYKQEGVRAFDAIEDTSRLNTIEEKNGRTLDSALLGDMARSEVQSYLLYRLWAVGDYDYAYGRTYLEAFYVLIPKWIWPDRPDGKVRKGTEALHGRAVYDARMFHASQVYGLAGEAMLNFPPILAPLFFFVLAFVVSRCRTLMLAEQNDPRLLLAPLLANAMIILPAADLDNIIVWFLTVALGPLVVLRACCTVQRRAGTPTNL